MKLFNVVNYPECDLKDKVILRLLQELGESRRDQSSDGSNGWSLAFDLDTMQPVWTRESFVTFWTP